jgi:hypothetical protein
MTVLPGPAFVERASATWSSGYVAAMVGLSLPAAAAECRQPLPYTAFPHHQHLAHSLLERLDPLAHRRERDIQPLHRVKAAELDHRGCGSRTPRRITLPLTACLQTSGRR